MQQQLAANKAELPGLSAKRNELTNEIPRLKLGHAAGAFVFYNLKSAAGKFWTSQETCEGNTSERRVVF